MWQVDSPIASNKIQTMIPPSLLLKPAPTDLYTEIWERKHTDINIKDFMDLTEIHGFHYQQWNPPEYYGNLQIYKDFTNIYQNVQNNLNMYICRLLITKHQTNTGHCCPLKRGNTQSAFTFGSQYWQNVRWQIFNIEDLYEIHRFHNITQWNPRKYWWNPRI